MAKTEYFYLSGKAKWCTGNNPDKYGFWSTVLYPDDKAWEIWKTLKDRGILNETTEDADGKFVRLRRPVVRKYRDGRQTPMEPLIIVDKNGKPFDGNIGNGSDITCKIECYGYPGIGASRGKTVYAIRLMAIRVDNLVEFNSDAFRPAAAKLVEGLKDAPEPIF